MIKLLPVLSSLIVLAASLPAQDVTVTPVEWAGPPPAPDSLPVARFSPSLPRSIRASDEISYVVVNTVKDSDGGALTLDIRGSNAVVEDAVKKELRDGWHLGAAKVNGQAVVSSYRCTVIYNPKSAQPQGPDATPRLVAAGLVRLPDRMFPDNGDTVIVRVRISVDATGAVTAVETNLKEPKIAHSVERAIGAWRFAPARAQGNPIPATVNLTAVAESPHSHVKDGKSEQPRALKQKAPTYPFELRKARIRGDVLVDFVVDTMGHVQDEKVIRSNSPAFNQPALDAVHDWVFRPGIRNGRVVNVHMQVPVIFDLDGVAAEEQFSVGSGRPSKLPPEYRYDTAPVVQGVVLPVYPFDLLRDNARGTVKLTMLVDDQGRVVETRVDKATRPEFGAAIQAAAEAFRCTPALRDGKPTITLLGYEWDFDLAMQLPWDLHATVQDDRDLIQTASKHPERVVSAAKLDEPLKPTSRTPPLFPLEEMRKHTAEGDAVIEILIDEHGRARCPRIVSASAPGFGYSAAQAALYWKFHPPSAGGKRVITKVQIPFHFSLPK